MLILHETMRLESTKKSTENFMSAAINVVCYKWKTLANGESPLMVRVAKGGKRTMQSLGISINPKYWDFTRNKPKPNCPNKEYIQKIILDKQQELQRRMLELFMSCTSFSYVLLRLTSTDGGSYSAPDERLQGYTVRPFEYVASWKFFVCFCKFKLSFWKTRFWCWYI